MKHTILVTLTALSLSLGLQAKTYVCNEDSNSTVGGIYQIEIGKTESKIAHFRQLDNGKWKKFESGYLNKQNGTSLEFITPDRMIRVNLDQASDNGFFKASLQLEDNSGFGPYISSSVLHTAAECTVKEVPTFEADRFVQPANMPLDSEKFLRLMEAVYKDEMDGYADVPAFTLVSPDRTDYIIVYFWMSGSAGVRDIHWGGISSSKERIINEEVLPKLKKGWTMLPVYSNKEGVKIFKTIKIK